MNKKVNFLIALFSSFLFFIGITSSVTAAELKFSVEPQITENQLDKSKTYFDLLVKPNDKQALKIHLRNDTDKSVTVEADVKTATTNLNGVVEYSKSNSKPDKTLAHDMEDILKPEKKSITIPAKGQADYTFNLTVPAQKFEGILVGGITLQEKVDDKISKQKEDKNGLSIENRYAYAVAVVLHGSKEKPVIKSDIKLAKVKAGQNNARTVINATLRNTKPKFMNKLSIDAKIMKKGKKEVLYSSKGKDMQMAPNSVFSYPVPLNGEEIKAGKYTLDLTVKANGDEKFHFSKNFEVNREEAATYNKKDVQIKKDYTWLYILIGVVVLLIILIIVVLVYRNKVRKKEREMKKMKREMRIMSEQNKQDND